MDNGIGKIGNTPLSQLVAVSVTQIRGGATLVYGRASGKYATMRATSITKEFCFTTDTNLLWTEDLALYERFQAHGFTVIAVPEALRFEYNGTRKMNTILMAALQQAKTFAELENPSEMERGYDKDLAQAVLEELDAVYPKPMTNIEVKHRLSPEPSDRALLTVLDALEGDGLITGKGLHESTSGKRLLEVMANIKITGEGRKQLASAQSPLVIPSGGTVIQGDQNIVYGSAGAVGRHAIGTINYQQAWSQLETNVDLKQLAIQLDHLRTAYSPSPEFRRTHARTAGLLAEAEEFAEQGDGDKVMETLSKVGHYILDFATDVGTDLAAKVIAKATGLEP